MKLLLAMSVSALMLVGCGGGSVPSPAGGLDVTAAQQAAAALRAARMPLRLDSVSYASIAVMAKPGTDVLIPTYVDEQDSVTGLYYHLTYSAGLASHTDFFTDSAHSAPAGSIISQAPVWTNGDYPVSVTSQVVDFEGITGEMTFTKYFMGIDTAHSSIRLTDQLGETLDFDVQLVDVRRTTAVQIADPMGTASLSYQTGSSGDGSEVGAYTDSAENSGAFTIHADGSSILTVQSHSSQPLVTAIATAAGQLTLQFPDGTSQTVANLDHVDPETISVS
jgi:VCBS repeat-containing protein